MYSDLKYINAGHTMIEAVFAQGVRIVEPEDQERWTRCLGGDFGPIAPYTEATETAQARGASTVDVPTVTTAQFALALLADGKLPVAETAINANPAAAIIWARSATVARRGDFLTALLTIFTLTQIDDLFAAAADIII